MSDISGMAALPDREMSGSGEAATDDAQADGFAAMLAAMWMPLIAQPMPENKMAAPPETAAPDVAAVSAAPPVNAAPALMNAAPKLMNAAPTLMNTAPLPDKLSVAATRKPANEQPVTIDAAPQAAIQPAPTVKTGTVTLSNLARLVTADKAVTENDSQPVMTAAQSWRPEPAPRTAENKPEFTAQTFLSRAEAQLPAPATPLSFPFEFDSQPVITAIESAPAPERVAAYAPGVTSDVDQDLNAADPGTELPADRSINIQPATYSQMPQGEVRQAASSSLLQTVGPLPTSDKLATHRTTILNRDQSIDDHQLIQKQHTPETAEQLTADREASVPSPVEPRPLPPAPEFQAERSGLIRRVIEQTAPAPQPSAATITTASPVTSAVISREALPLIPVRTEPGKISFNVRTGEPRETRPATAQGRRDAVQADESNIETVPPARSLKLALKPLVAEFHAADNDAPPASATEFSAPESVPPVMVQTNRAAQSVEKNVAVDAPTVISQTAGQVITVAERMAHRETRAISLSLNPKDLGRLEVRITRDDDGRVSAQFTAEHEMTRHALREGLTDLRQTLERAGLPVDRLEIKATTPDPGQFTGSAHGQSQQSLHDQPASHRFATADPADDEVVNQERTLNQPRPDNRLLSRRA
ncbi:MAG: flagellar hook-length control protein FliK [Blastocatellia bacterium]